MALKREACVDRRGGGGAGVGVCQEGQCHAVFSSLINLPDQGVCSLWTNIKAVAEGWGGGSSVFFVSAYFNTIPSHLKIFSFPAKVNGTNHTDKIRRGDCLTSLT